MAETPTITEKETITGLYAGSKRLNVCLMQITKTSLCLTTEQDFQIVLSYAIIRTISRTEDNALTITFHAPHTVIPDEGDTLFVSLYAITTDKSGSYRISKDRDWAGFWEYHLVMAVEDYRNTVGPEEKTDDEPVFIERAECSTHGLMDYEIVSSSQEVLFSAGNQKNIPVMIYTTDTRILIKRNNHDFISIPYSVIMDVSALIAETVYLLMSYPQNLSCFPQPVTVLSFSRIPDEKEDHSKLRSSLWQQNWILRITERADRVARREGMVDIADVTSLVEEVRHSPTKYELSVYAQHGWDKVCHATIETLNSWSPDLYLFVSYLSREYESMRVRSELEPDPSRQEAYLGSQMAYASILTYIAHMTLHGH